MDHQFLFDPYGLARTSDPVTSQQAADQIDTDGTLANMTRHVLELVRANPGSTGRELDELSDTTDGQAHKRLSELERDCQVRRGDSRQCKISGRQAATWWPAGGK
ncbi:MAG: hypothetical protein ABGX16_07760 [Pirellulales bacterium]